ncbi:hypothetical protein GCM10009091_20210 [Pseudomonas brenneri]|nr:hypothetical protein GCM10009091_20210 [Pseudomonas brenneri]
MNCRCRACSIYRSELAREKRKITTFRQAPRIIVDDLRRQAGSYTGGVKE